MATHSSTPAWKIPWVEEPGRLQSMGSLRVRHKWVTSLSLFTFMHWRRKWQNTPVFLPGESQGWGSLVGCRLWCRTESDMTEVTKQQHCFVGGSQWRRQSGRWKTYSPVFRFKFWLYPWVELISPFLGLHFIMYQLNDKGNWSYRALLALACLAPPSSLLGLGSLSLSTTDLA